MVPRLQTIVLVGKNFLRMGRFSKCIGTKATTDQKRMAIDKDAPRGRRDSLCRAPSRKQSRTHAMGHSLNKDVDDCVARHVAVGYGLKEGDLGYSTRFSRQTLREQHECIQTCDGSSARDGERSSHFQSHLPRYTKIHSYTHRNSWRARHLRSRAWVSGGSPCSRLKWPGEAWRQTRDEARNRRPVVPL
jgi:hypothetical protein